MFGAHLPELLIVLVLALVVFGPKRLPEIGGALGKSIREFRDGTSDLKDKATGHDSEPAQIPGIPGERTVRSEQTAASTPQERDSHSN